MAELTTIRSIEGRYGDVANVADHLAEVGGTDHWAAFVSALDTGKDVFVPSGVSWFLDNDGDPMAFTADGQRMYGDGNISVSGSGGIFNPHSYNAIEGLKFYADANFSGRIFSFNPDQVEIRIAHNRFFYHTDSPGTTIYMTQAASRCVIEGNTQSGGNYFIYSVGGYRNSVIGNTIHGKAGATRGILFNGGYENTVVGNVVRNAITGIAWLSFRQIGSGNMMKGNVVVGNSVSDISEEGISFDCNGNSDSQLPEHGTKPLLVVTTATNSATQTTINYSGGVSDNWANGYQMVVLNGAAAGFTAPIEDSTSTSIIISRGGGNIQAILAAGDDILITTGAIQNVIAGNSVMRAGTGIMLWGSSWFNRVEGNQLVDVMTGVIATSVVGVMNCWSGYNSIEGNTISIYKAASAEGDSGNAIDVYTQEYATPDAAVTIHNPGYRISRNKVSNKGIVLIDLYNARAYDNDVAVGVLDISNCTGFTQGQNTLGGSAASFA